RLGAGKGLSSCLYVTVGTGIGGGLVAEGRLVHGLLHPEWGHIPMRLHPDDPMPNGVCPSHKGCLEGMASGPSIEKRWGAPGRELPEGHAAWELEAHYLGQLCATAVLTVSPEVIVLGGGVMGRESLYPLVRRRAAEYLNGYIQHPAVLRHIDRYIVAPGLGVNSGAVGALLLVADQL
ncbi:MAG: ROK family protein, partial [Clostridiales bacterium]|nr:ROK family protein [Clostridiales bacterium]